MTEQEIQKLKDEIKHASRLIIRYCDHIDDLEDIAPTGLKMLMLANDWHSPFIALNKLLKIIDTNVTLLKKEGIKVKVKKFALNCLITQKGKPDCGSCEHYRSGKDCTYHCGVKFEAYERIKI